MKINMLRPKKIRRKIAAVVLLSKKLQQPVDRLKCVSFALSWHQRIYIIVCNIYHRN
ncbi:hypothetical protein Cst_c24330 [Thermoclostridium stercorarium subsp. stercorarium DSM 8532]|uniref:Uncharacterized protein n=1 Tax=Thermoclostridium stercorarium (strain ATCC 35414 / DSM 8532 / NCIMB 11754) TaxID=1121335 RepID=L7VUY3_THES1|nr:hypothetical protein Cst_c24330 [Thermoclostridium stercorarium subsp. stercorarium DSM 8532]